MRSQLFFGLLAVACSLWLILPNNLEEKMSFRAMKHPEEYMSNVSLKTYTIDGLLKNELHAEYWAYLPEKNCSELTTPHLTVYKPDKTVWHIDAKQGRVSQPSLAKVQEVELSDHVVIRRPATAKSVPIKLETAQIRYQPDKEYAESDEFVSLSKPNLTVTSQGMKAFLDRGFVELLHDVKTYYVAKDDPKQKR